MKKCTECGILKESKDFYSQRSKCKNCYNSVRSKKYNSDSDFREKRSRQIQQRKYRLRKEDPEYLLRDNISSLLRTSFRKRRMSKKLFREYGIDVASILDAIGPRPGEEFHLDHILPQSVFDYSDPFQVWACNHQDNFQWLLGEENCSKKDEFDEQSLSTFLSRMRAVWDGRKL